MGSKPITSKIKLTSKQSAPCKQTKEKSLANKLGHGALDILGLIPGIGEFADGANAAWYGAEGDYANAALSAAAMVPFAGWAATGAKLGMKAVPKTTKNVINVANKAKSAKKVHVKNLKNTSLGKTMLGKSSINEADKFLSNPIREAKKYRVWGTGIDAAIGDIDEPSNYVEKPKPPKEGGWGSSRTSQGSKRIAKLVQIRNNHEKGSEEYNTAQNEINKIYGVKKRH